MKTHVVLLTLLLLFAGALAAEAQYRVEMENGTVLETRTQPEEVEWDPDVVLLTTGTGLPIALHRSEIASVVSVVDETGFARRLDASTIELGMTTNDLVEENEEGELVATYDDGSGQVVVPVLPDYTVDQFVSVPVAGEATGGIPVGEIFD